MFVKICIAICLFGFTWVTLCTTSTVQSYIVHQSCRVHHQSALRQGLICIHLLLSRLADPSNILSHAAYKGLQVIRVVWGHVEDLRRLLGVPGAISPCCKWTYPLQYARWGWRFHFEVLAESFPSWHSWWETTTFIMNCNGGYSSSLETIAYFLTQEAAHLLVHFKFLRVYFIHSCACNHLKTINTFKVIQCNNYNISRTPSNPSINKWSSQYSVHRIRKGIIEELKRGEDSNLNLIIFIT